MDTEDWTDYWQTPTETGGLHFYGVPIHAFTEEEVLTRFISQNETVSP
jgi:hypothetical protein